MIRNRIFLPMHVVFSAIFAISIFLTSPAIAGCNTLVERDVARTVAIQNIEYLRRNYAKATDLIGLNTKASIEQGREIYQRVFTPDAKISVIENGKIVFTAVGPDTWVDIATNALSAFDNTQHLIGTQLVDIQSLPDDSCNGGEATMTSYLQAWHDDPDRILDIFIGTYHDKIRFKQDSGWQIYEMILEKVSGEITHK